MSKASSAGDPGQSKDVLDTYLGTRALQERFITPDQLKDALAEQGRDLASRKTGARPLGAILVAKGYLTHAQIQSLILSQSANTDPGAYAPFGKYRLVRELGRGGMGIVYEAVESGLGRKVALKTMIVSPYADPKDAKLDEERFLREAQLSASLPKHPNIVGVYEVGVVGGRRYLAMELIDGKPMSDWKKEASVTLKQEVEVLRTAALAVHHAHEHGVIHRDLKPQNILIDAKNEPHITDFGLAKMVGENLSVSLTGAGTVVGTPAYISPEQAQGLRTTDRRTDVYALGVMLFEILTGRPPFIGNSAMEILMKASKNPVPSATNLMKVRLSPDQAKGLDDICQKALTKKAADRYPSAAAFAADLAKWLGGEEVRVVLPTRRMTRPAPAKWGLLAGGLVAAVVLGAVLLRPSAPPESDPAEETRRITEQRKRKAEEERLKADREKLEAERSALEAKAKAVDQDLKSMNLRLLKAVEVRNAAALRPGLVAEYFGGLNFEILSLRRVDPDMNFKFRGGPAWPNGPAENVSVRWRGYLKIPEKGSYVFHAWCGDGIRLFVDGTEVLASWGPRGFALDTGIALLEAGHHQITAEAFCAAAQGGIYVSLKKSDDPGKPVSGAALFFHDPASFEPLSRKAGLEYFDWSAVPGAQEAEALQVLEATPGSWFTLPFGRKKGMVIWGKGSKTGDRFKVAFEAPESGEKTLILALSRVKNSGIFRISVNGTVVAKDLDLYFPGNQMLEWEFKKAPVRKGLNELEFAIVGVNPAAVEWTKGDGLPRLGFDYLRIR